MAASPELVSYIRQQTQEGTTAEELRIALMESGWGEYEIENALHDVAAGLHPVTAGASIHEDLAQVRGMVAHLASRVKALETVLVSEPSSLPSGQQIPLPSGNVGPGRELPASHEPSRTTRILSLIGALILFWATGSYLSVQQAEEGSSAYGVLGILSAIGLGSLFVAYRSMHRHLHWKAQYATAIGITLWGLLAWHAWHTLHLVEWATAAGIGILLVVLTVVFARWIERFNR
jgi:hypothetical protein